MAAAYLFHLCQNHPFIDGNKRVLNRIEDSAVVQAKRQAKPPGETACPTFGYQWLGPSRSDTAMKPYRSATIFWICFRLSSGSMVGLYSMATYPSYLVSAMAASTLRWLISPVGG